MIDSLKRIGQRRQRGHVVLKLPARMLSDDHRTVEESDAVRKVDTALREFNDRISELLFLLSEGEAGEVSVSLVRGATETKGAHDRLEAGNDGPNRPSPDAKRGTLVVDVARFGYEETTLEFFDGTQVRVPGTQSHHWLVRRIAALIHTSDIDTVVVDDAGIGGPVINRLRKLQSEGDIPPDVAILYKRRTGTKGHGEGNPRYTVQFPSNGDGSDKPFSICELDTGYIFVRQGSTSKAMPNMPKTKTEIHLSRERLVELHTEIGRLLEVEDVPLRESETSWLTPLRDVLMRGTDFSITNVGSQYGFEFRLDGPNPSVNSDQDTCSCSYEVPFDDILLDKGSDVIKRTVKKLTSAYISLASDPQTDKRD